MVQVHIVSGGLWNQYRKDMCALVTQPCMKAETGVGFIFCLLLNLELSSRTLMPVHRVKEWAEKWKMRM